MPRIAHILIANRGEIALRVTRSARALGLQVSAIYSDADADAPHVRAADLALRIGRAELADSYLNIAAIVAAAKRAGADAVHPGYGLLSEDAEFARACESAGLVFIGPPAATIELMGDKRRARIAMRAAGVACVPGYDGEDQRDATLAREAETIGYPLMVKAAAGGGGRGMRRVANAAQLQEALARARSEAEHAFGDGRLILERALLGARHVEVQIFGDRFGNAIALGERDCSLQRRFQKLIEEAPSPAVDAALRERLFSAAVLAAKSSGYVGAGTVELLLEPNGAFYFLEMNTRLQVEHPVTELVTGLDLVAWQIAIARGEPLPLAQHELSLRGHAIEARLYAENPSRGFLPETGRVLALELPNGEGVRIDHALAEGLVIGSHYDAMLGKVIAHGRDREEARSRLTAALARLVVLGVRTNQDFLRELIEHERFVSGAATTDFLATHTLTDPSAVPTPRTLALAALAALARAPRGYPRELTGFTNCPALAWPIELESQTGRHALAIEPDASGSYAIRSETESFRARAFEVEGTHGTVELDGTLESFRCAWDGARLYVHSRAGTHSFRELTHAGECTEKKSGRALAPMDGTLIEVTVRVGQAVVAGQSLCVVAAMKLELHVAADQDGTVAAIHCARGDQVKARQLLVEIRALDVQPEPAAPAERS